MEKETYENYDVETLEYQLSLCNNREISKVVPEIIEIEEENDECKGEKRDEGSKEIYVAIGKDDLEVLKWVIAHVVVPGGRVNLIHVFPPISSISTPVGRLWVGQLSPEQAKVYAIEEHNRRRNLLHKYIRLCVENKVNVDTILIESNETTKSIMDLIPVLNITSLVMGTKHPSSSRKLIKGSNKGTMVQKNAPEYCKVILVYTGKKSLNNEGNIYHTSSSFSNVKQNKVPTRPTYEGNYKQCTCFPVKFY
ncbi:uncharacterized protein LOC130800165 [Amaranthus tricolor]|uniref:uncharacterized protein LOC130800165 n=1 Tax=Amaranthus tricolor TaxID=29722 RepID=UPI002584660A|nr:uncharacterized protein LOC130800165 [Amaranthus tricolor]